MAARKSTASVVNFTKGRVDRFTCPDRQSEAKLWDSTVTGLGLRARPGGGKTYIFQARLHGRTVKQTIGSPAAWGIDEARAEARRLRVLVDQGVHPGDERRAREEAAEQERRAKALEAVTVADVWADYIADRRRGWSERHLGDHAKVMQAPGQKRARSRKRTVAGPLYPLRDVPVSDLTAERLQGWLEREARRRPTAAALAYRLLRSCLHWTAEHPSYRGLVEPHRLFTGNVRRAVPKPQAKSDALQREQLPAWFEAVRALPNPIQSAYLQALLLTGARRNELSRVRWADVDFQWRSIAIRDKVEGERVIPLPPYLADLLAGLPRVNRYVFASPTAKAGYIADANHAHTRAVKAAGLPPVTLHGLRRSFGTLSEWVEAPVGVVAQIQGHKPSALAEKHYRRRPLDLLRKWHTRIEGWILEQAGIQQPTENEAGQLRVVK
ncbi:hypothetical protein KBTX_02778 [wastewater metagenome]|uniref:Tyr recombinase domain-containing protein n=2 Tax=unclassified sequences TaxID=12908 RepID=A0A5B8RCA7_9ZZZZ|nr:integrase family protein [Arhodomonas sp. KWT]QEA06440.1 hypothetical protein KBTEX_02778 [uncultured organism]